MELDKAYEMVLADLEERNSHTIGRLLRWDIQGDPQDEMMFRAWLVAKNFIEQYEWDNSKQPLYELLYETLDFFPIVWDN
jgi:hypothetical protein